MQRMRFHFSRAFTLASEPLFPIPNTRIPRCYGTYIVRIYKPINAKHIDKTYSPQKIEIDLFMFFKQQYNTQRYTNYFLSMLKKTINFAMVRCVASSIMPNYPLSMLIILHGSRVKFQSSKKNNIDKV